MSNLDRASVNRRIQSSEKTVKILKAFFENENYCFTSFTSKNHGELMQKIIQNSNEEDNRESQSLCSDPSLNDFINSLCRIFSPSPSTTDPNQTITNHDGMVKYNIYSLQSISSTTTADSVKSIWLPRSMIISDAHQILSTLLYSDDISKLPVDLADYVLIYENIMISLENQSKELYEEILKISFRLNRFALPPFRLLVIHRSQLLLLERKESTPVLTENGSLSIAQLIMFPLIPTYSDQYDDENFPGTQILSVVNSGRDYWPIPEIKIGFIRSALIHPLKYDELRRIIANIVRANDGLGDVRMSVDKYLELLQLIFRQVNGDVPNNQSIIPSLKKLVHIYDHPLLIALPYDRLILSQFSRSKCSDGRYAQGIMADGKYYSLANNRYTSMLQLKINRGSIIHLRFNEESDTISNGNLLKASAMIINESYDEVSKHSCSIHYDNSTACLIFPLSVVDSMMSSYRMIRYESRVDFLRSFFMISNNWLDSSMKINKSIAYNMNSSVIDDADSGRTAIPRHEHYFHAETVDDNRFARLINYPSTTSLLPLVNKPECSNCLSLLDDDNLECPYCTQIFCRTCIEHNYVDDSDDRCCPKCHNLVNISDYRRSTIIGRLEKEGISALQCSECHQVSMYHRLCCDPNCATLFCNNCYKRIASSQSVPVTQAHGSHETIKCLQCNTANTFVSNAVLYYSERIIEYQTAKNIESLSNISLARCTLPNSVWTEEEWSPDEGTLEENYNRLLSVINFKGSHIHFGEENKERPLLVINEPPEFMCPETLQLSYWSSESEISQWENDNRVVFFEYNRRSVAAYIPHFSKLTVRSSRFRDHFMLDESFLCVTYDYDFINTKDQNISYMRGGLSYKRPCGWYRKAIRVVNKYDNDEWLGRTDKAWPVAYHGTTADNVKSILQNGLRAGGSNGIPISNGRMHGSGIYLSPDPAYSGRINYSRPFVVDGHRHQLMFQVRVKHDESLTEPVHGAPIWLCSNPSNIRPYGILIKEMQ